MIIRILAFCSYLTCWESQKNAASPAAAQIPPCRWEHSCPEVLCQILAWALTGPVKSFLFPQKTQLSTNPTSIKPNEGKLRHRHRKSSPMGRQRLKTNFMVHWTAKAESHFIELDHLQVLALTLTTFSEEQWDVQCLEAFVCDTALTRLGHYRSHQLLQQKGFH